MPQARNGYERIGPLSRAAHSPDMKTLYDFSIDILPPSVNRLYKVGSRRGSTYVYKDANIRNFMEYAGYMLPRPDAEITTPVRLDVVFSFHETSFDKSDLDNRLKLLCDALEARGVLKNDNLIYEIRCRKERSDTVDRTSGSFYPLE